MVGDTEEGCTVQLNPFAISEGSYASLMTNEELIF
jgi:hypothetical protein